MVTLSEQVTDGNRHSALAVELARLRAENARLLRLLNLTRQEATPPGPWQSGLFEAPPGLVHADSPPQAKVALFGALYGRSSPSRRVTTSAYCSAAADRTSRPARATAIQAARTRLDELNTVTRPMAGSPGGTPPTDLVPRQLAGGLVEPGAADATMLRAEVAVT